jgi:osmoprotectant transport system permease protein
MGIFGDVWQWFLNPVHWHGDMGVPNRLFEHVQMAGLSTILAAAVALPAGLVIGHTRRMEFLAVSIANIGRALPSFGILGIVFPLTASLPGFGFWPTLIALFLLAIPPILTNTYVGVKNVDADTVEAAQGMGMSGREVLMGIELPLAAPLIVGGLRTATVQVVATATLAAIVGWGGLGRYIIDGFHQGNTVMVLAGAILVALLAIVTELGLGVVERLVHPKTTTAPRFRPAFERAGPAPLPSARGL